MSPTTNDLQTASEHLRSGRLNEAAQLLDRVLEANPQNADGLRMRGNLALQRKEYVRAEDCFLGVLQLQPGDMQSRFELANALLGQGKTDKAVAHFQVVLSACPNDAKLHNELGILMANLGRWEEAAECLRQVVRVHPEFGPGHNNLGNVLDEQGRTAEAVECFRKAVAADPTMAPAYYNLANGLKALGRLEEAIAQYRLGLQADPAAADGYYLLAAALRDAGNTDEAIANYREALRIQPEHTAAQFELGCVLKSQGVLSEASALLEQVVRAIPDEADAHAQYGLTLKALERPEAFAALERALALKPDLPEAHLALGDLKSDRGDLAGAIRCYEQAACYRPGSVVAFTNLGNTFRTKGQNAQALAAYEQAVRLRPDLAETHLNLGLLKRILKRNDEAIVHFRKALELKPDYVEALNGLGAALEKQGDSEAAVACFREVVRLQPDNVEAHNNLGASLCSLGELGEAMDSYDEGLRVNDDRGVLPPAIAEGRALFERAMALNPDYAEARGNLGRLLLGLGEKQNARSTIDEARAFLERAVQLKPDFIEAHGNLAKLLADQGDLAGSLAHYDEVLRRDPSLASLHKNRAMTLLLSGDFAHGWPEYEWRWREKDAPKRPWPRPEWDGSPLQGRAIMLHCEQGLGDTLQFIRYAPRVQEQGGQPRIVAPKSWIPILSTCAVLDPARVEFCEQEEVLPQFDVFAALMSLPRLFETDLTSIPANVPYLSADEALVAQWRTSLGKERGFRVGIVWQGNPDFGNDRVRSMPLASFAPLAAVEGVRLVSLQKGFGSEQIDQVDFPILDLGSQFSDVAMVDAAAVIRSLDLVISCDTAMLHLAGALAAPAWAAIPYAPDWRWLLDRTDSPWYPTLRLFRQSQPGDWPGVFQRMAEALATHVAQQETRR